jgi:hypothetical protein
MSISTLIGVLITSPQRTVYQGDDETEANRIFDIYVDQSKNSVGSRAEGESVTIFENYGTGTDIIREHDGHLEQNDV